MNKIKNIIKRNIKSIMCFVSGVVIAGGICVIGTTIMSSNEISYDNGESGLNANTLQKAINELNIKATTKIAEAELKCPEGKTCQTINYTNSNIEAAYQYDSANCVTGEETTCIKIPIITNISVAPGTIIKYKVNNSTTKYFHVIKDNGTTLTMQDRNTTVYNKAWYAASDSAVNGPTTILPALENATNGWNNVNSQTYEMGTTNLSGLANGKYTKCDPYDSCTSNGYTLSSRTGKARMITVQELLSLGCTDIKRSCPKWMYNYLNDSTGYGGTVNDAKDGKNNGYWTKTSSGDMGAYAVSYGGRIRDDFTSSSGAAYGARAIVVIDKKSI